MLSGGPNWELQENVILYWQGLQCLVEDLIGSSRQMFEGVVKIWQQLRRRSRRRQTAIYLLEFNVPDNPK